MTATAPCPDCNRPYALNDDGDVRRHGCKANVIGLPWPRPMTTPNDRHHHHHKAALMAQMRSDARWSIRAAKVAPRDRAVLTLHWRIPDNRRHDADSLQLALKAVTDAAVDEGVLPDDDWRHVPTAAMTIHPPQPGMPGAMWLSIERPA